MDINDLTTATLEELHEDLVECSKAAADPQSPSGYKIRLHVSISRMVAELIRRDTNKLLEEKADAQHYAALNRVRS